MTSSDLFKAILMSISMCVCINQGRHRGKEKETDYAVWNTVVRYSVVIYGHCVRFNQTPDYSVLGQIQG